MTKKKGDAMETTKTTEPMETTEAQDTNVQAAVNAGVSEEDIQAALEMLAKKRKRDAVRAEKIASGELVPKKYKAKPWSELTAEQKDKRKAQSAKWAKRQRDLAKLAKEHGLDRAVGA
jgi:hypothetical protein